MPSSRREESLAHSTYVTELVAFVCVQLHFSSARFIAAVRAAAQAMETPKVDEELDQTNGRWRNALAIFDKKTKKFNVYLFTFKMLIFALKMYPFAVPLGFMYKHHHGFFVPVGAAAATLMTFKPMFSNLLKGKDPVDREKGRFLGTVSAAVVAMAYIQLHQWKWLPGIQGLFARLLCACMDEANAHRNFAASITGGVWLLGQLAGRAPWEPLRCLQGCAEKCHGDYLCVLGQLAAELLPLYDTRLCGLLQEMKCRYCGDDGQIEKPYIQLLPSDHKSYPNLIKRLMGHGGRLTLAVRIFRAGGRVRDRCGKRSSALITTVSIGHANALLVRRPRDGSFRSPKTQGFESREWKWRRRSPPTIPRRRRD